MAGESLRVVSGNAAGTEIAIGQSLLLGSMVGGTGTLGGDTGLAPEHARFTREPDGRLLITELGGATMVNGRRITGDVPVRAGDTINVGGSTVQLIDQVGRAPQATSFRSVQGAVASPPPSPPQPAAAAAPASAGALGPQSLRIVSGPAAGSQIPMGGAFVIGRATTGLGRLGDDPELSREHARITRGPGGALVVEDLGSTNGTYVNDQRIGAPAELRPGDRIRVGETTLEVSTEAAPARPASAPVAAQRPAPQQTSPAMVAVAVIVAIAVVVAVLLATGVI